MLGIPSPIEQLFRAVQILPLAGHPVKLNQRQLDPRMTLRLIEFTRHEIATYQVGILQGNIQKLTFTGRLIGGHRRLVEVSHVEQLMTADCIDPTFVGPMRLQLFRGHDFGGRVEIAVRLLRRSDPFDDFVGLRFQWRIRLYRYRIIHRTQHGSHYAVRPWRTAVRAPFYSRRLGEIVDNAGFLTLLEYMRHRREPVGFQPRRPVPILNLHLLEPYRLNGIIVPNFRRLHERLK